MEILLPWGYIKAMRRSHFILIATAIVSCPLLATANTKQPKTLGTFEAWQAYVQGEGKAKTCFALARPEKSEPKPAKRGDAYLMISHRPAEQVRNEVNYDAGFPLKKGAPVEAQAGAKKFALTVFDQKDYEEHAFAANPDEDKAFTESLTKSGQLVLKSMPRQGPAITDTISLKGVGSALKAIGDACK